MLAGRDSLVVLPTGGGKSLCFQAPALASEGLARGRVAADLADEGSGRHAGRQRRVGGLLQQLAAVGAEVRGRARRARGPVSTALRRARAAGRRRRRWFPQPAVVAAGQLHRGRRGALHQPVGPRLPARVSPARRGCASAGRRSACTPTPRPRPRACGATSSRSSGCAIPRSWSARSIGPNLVYRVLARSQLQGADPRRARAPPRSGRHHLLLVAQGSRRAGAVAAGHRLARAAVSRGHGGRRSPSQPGCVPERRDRPDRRDGRVRDGHRSVGRALRDPRRRAAIARALSAGIGPCRPRRARGRVRADCVGRRFPEVADDAREERRAVRRAARPAARHRALRGERRLPPQAAGRVISARRSPRTTAARATTASASSSRSRMRSRSRARSCRASRASASASARRTSPTCCAAATASRCGRAAITSCRCSA